MTAWFAPTVVEAYRCTVETGGTACGTITLTGTGEVATGVSVPERSHRFALDQNTPNPFNPSTTIRFELPQEGPASLAIYSVEGRRIRLYSLGTMPAGTNRFVWDGRDDRGTPVPSGVYFYRLRAGAYDETKRMVLVR